VSYTIATSPVQGLCYVLEEEIMDKDRVEGSAKEIKGAVKQAVGKAAGNAKLARMARPTKLRARFRTPSAASKTP
jgi:hypothetical protein